MPPTLLSLNIAPNSSGPVTSPPAFRKEAVTHRCKVTPSGLEGDTPTADGVLAKAIYAYPSEHYPFWDTVRAQMGRAGWEDRLPYGTLGENLTLAGMLETYTFIGDLLRFPDCTLAVSQPGAARRELEEALGFKEAPKAMLAQAWCGFHLAVRVPGTLAVDDPFELIPGPRDIGIAELFRARNPSG